MSAPQKWRAAQRKATQALKEYRRASGETERMRQMFIARAAISEALQVDNRPPSGAKERKQ